MKYLVCNFKNKLLKDDILKYILKFKGKFNVISNYKFIDISSTKIRSDIYKYRKYLDDRVFKYIIDNKLYGGSYE